MTLPRVRAGPRSTDGGPPDGWTPILGAPDSTSFAGERADPKRTVVHTGSLAATDS